MNRQILSLCLCLVLVACKKDRETIVPASVIQGSIHVISNQASSTISYKIQATGLLETGVYFSTDSADIIHSREKATKIISTKSEKADEFISNLINLSPLTTYFYIIYIKDPKGNYVYSAPAKFICQGYGIKWETDFSQQIKLIDILYKDVILIGQPVNTDIKNYKVTLGSIPCMLWKIARVDPLSADYKFYIQVPAPTPRGKYKMTLTYLDKIIFSDDLEVLKGNYYYLSKVTQHPSPSPNLSYFRFDNKQYTIDLGTKKMFSWNSLSNQWLDEGNVPSAQYFRTGGSGIELNSRVWFPPPGNTSEEAFYSYTPGSKTWEQFLLSKAKSSDDYLSTLGAFVYEEKIYCLVRQGRNISTGYITESLLKVFNPADKSWKVVMSLNNSAWDYKGVVVNGKVYILEVMSGTVDKYKSTLYELDMNNMSLNKKPDITWYDLPQGSLRPALFGYKNHVFVFGGLQSNTQVSTDMYEYAPEDNSWTRIHVTPNADIGGSNSFCNVFNDKIYIGFGYKSGFQLSNFIWELDMNK